MLNTHVKLKRSVALLVALALVAHSLVAPTTQRNRAKRGSRRLGPIKRYTGRSNT